MKVTPIGKRILVRKCVQDHVRDSEGKVLLFMTDHSYEQCNTVEIVDVADDCQEFRREHIGNFIQVPERIEGIEELNLDEGLFFIRESIIEDAVEVGVLFIPEEGD